MSHGLNCPVCGSGEFGDCVCPINRQQHIDTLARLMESEVRKYPVRTSTQPWDGGIGWGLSLSGLARKVLDSTDPNLHDALIAALHANADRARVLAAHAAAGWLAEERGEGAFEGEFRLVTLWEPTP